MDKMEMNNSCFKTLAVQTVPYVFMDKNNVLRGLITNIMNELVKKYGICYTYDMKRSTKFRVGKYIAENKTYDGVMGQIQRGEYSMLMMPTLHPGGDGVEMSDMIEMEPFTVIYEYPSIESGFTGFIKPFNYQVWLIILLMIFGLCILYFVFLWVNKKDIRETRSQEGSFSTATLITLMIFMAQATITPRKLSHRFLLGTMLMVSLFIALSYKCNLKAALVIPKVKIPFRNIYELVEQDEIKWALAADNTVATIAQRSPEGNVFRKFYDRASYFLSDIGVMIRGIQKGEFAILVPQNIGIGIVVNTYPKEGPCILTLMEEGVWSRVIAVIFQKDFPLKDKFNDVLQRMREAGIIDLWKKNTFRRGLHCIEKVGATNKNVERPLHLGDVGGIFLILGGGMILASIVFILELVVSKFE